MPGQEQQGAASPNILGILMALIGGASPDASIAGLQPLTPPLAGQEPVQQAQELTMPSLRGIRDLSGGLLNG